MRGQLVNNMRTKSQLVIEEDTAIIRIPTALYSKQLTIKSDSNKSATSGEGNAYPSGAHEFDPGF
jgi:hypothetical protein